MQQQFLHDRKRAILNIYAKYEKGKYIRIRQIYYNYQRHLLLQQEHLLRHQIRFQHYGTLKSNNKPQHLSQPTVGTRKVLHQHSQLQQDMLLGREEIITMLHQKASVTTSIWYNRNEIAALRHRSI